MRVQSNIVGVLGAVREIAIASPQITSLVGEQIYPFAAPDYAVPPYIITGIDHVDAVKSSQKQSILRYGIGLDVFANYQTEIANIADALINGLTNFEGEVNSVPITRLAFVSAETQNPIREGAGEHEIIYTWSLIFTISL